MGRIKERAIKFAPIFFLAVFFIIFFWPVISGEYLPYSGDLIESDLTHINYPFRKLAADYLKVGEMPLWTHSIGNGYPIFAESQIGFFYPINLILYGLFSPLRAFGFSIVLHYFLLAFFVYLYLRLLKISRFSALLAGLVFSLSGFFITHLKHVNLVQAAIWLPFVFYLVEKFFQTRKFFYLVLTGIVFSLQILVGFPPMGYYTVLGSSLYFLFRTICFVRSLVQKSYSFKAKVIFKYFGLWLLVGVIVVGISAVQLIPQKELTNYSWRKGGISAGSKSLDLNNDPKNIINFIYPYFWGNPAQATFGQEFTELEDLSLFWENCSYVGIIFLFLALIAVYRLFRRNKAVFFYTALLILSLLLAFSYSSILSRQLSFWLIPGLKFLRTPGRFFLLSEFSLIVLGAFGLDFVLKKIGVKLSIFNKKKKIFLFVFLSVIVFILVIGELLVYHFYYNSLIKVDEWFQKPESVEFLEKDKSLYRIFPFGGEFSWFTIYLQSRGWLGDKTLLKNHLGVLEPNFNILFDIDSLEDIHGLKMKRQWRLAVWLDMIGVFPRLTSAIDFPKKNRIKLSKGFVKILGLQNVKYVLSFFNIESEGLILKKKIDFKEQMLPLRIYENKYVLPRAYVVGAAKIITTNDELLQDLKMIRALHNPDFEPEKTVILEKDIGLSNSDNFEGSEAKIIKYDSQEIEIEADLKDNGFLVLANSYYPGWKVFVDGEEKEILRANYVFQGVKLNQGRHEVKFVFDPLSYRIGKYISLFTLACLVFYFGVYLKKKGMTSRSETKQCDLGNK